MSREEKLILKMGLKAHPEGGFYKETYRSTIEFYPENGNSERNLMTSIYFLLTKDNFSGFHRIKSDELWFFHEGNALSIHSIDAQGKYKLFRLGPDDEQGESMQVLVPAGNWFASEIEKGGDYGLVSCVVAPGFDFEDFELANKDLVKIFPEHELIINRLIHQ